jgi:S1-C subfamily serine protease
MRVLLVDVSEESAGAIRDALAGQGYEITAKNGLSVDELLALSPEVLITEAAPSDLSCCGLVVQLRSRPFTESPLKVVMVVRGGALDRARALDLGVDDVISFPFDATEFAARIRTQFRERLPEEELQTKLKYVEVTENYAAAEKRRAWLIPAVFLIGLIAALAAFVSYFSLRHSNKEALQMRAEIAQLNYGVGQQGILAKRVEQTRDSLDSQARAAAGARESLQAQSKNLRAQMTSADGAQLESLRKQLKATEQRLTILEDGEKFAETIVHDYGPSVCLLHVVVEFRETASGKQIRMVVDSAGQPQISQKDMLQLDADGSGPPLRMDVFGTGFLATADGVLLTNHHVAEPWWKNDDLKQFTDQGATAYVQSYEAYFPGAMKGMSAKLDRVSTDADLAVLKLDGAPPAGAEVLKLNGAPSASVTGDPVVLIGYPTGIDGILARAGSDVVNKIAGQDQDVDRIMAQLAANGLIRPTTTQGHIGDLLKSEIVYDAATTSGGSGGPLFNKDGEVIGVNFAILKEFGGSNLAIPARYASQLLK